MFRARSTWTTLGYMPSGSCSSFCTKFSLPSLDISAPGTCRENLDLSSSTEYRDRERRTGCAVTVVGASASESESSFFSSGHRVGYSVVRLYLFSIACSNEGSIATTVGAHTWKRECSWLKWQLSETRLRPPITIGHRLAVFLSLCIAASCASTPVHLLNDFESCTNAVVEMISHSIYLLAHNSHRNITNTSSWHSLMTVTSEQRIMLIKKRQCGFTSASNCRHEYSSLFASDWYYASFLPLLPVSTSSHCRT